MIGWDLSRPDGAWWLSGDREVGPASAVGILSWVEMENKA